MPNMDIKRLLCMNSVLNIEWLSCRVRDKPIY